MADIVKQPTSRMGLVERFIQSCPKIPLMTDEEIQAEINAVRQVQE